MSKNILDNTLICIVCRLDSRRLPGKAMLPILEYPLIEILIKRLLRRFDSSNILICTSAESVNSVLNDVATKFSIAIHFGDKFDVMSRLLDGASSFKDLTTVVRVTADNPLIDFDLMYQMIVQHQAGLHEYTFTECVPRGLRSEVIDLKYLKSLHSRIIDTSNTEYMTYYLKEDYSSKLLFQPQIRFNNLTFTVDTQSQLDFVTRVVASSPRSYFSSTAELVETVYSIEGDSFTNIPPEVNSYDPLKFVIASRFQQ